MNIIHTFGNWIIVVSFTLSAVIKYLNINFVSQLDFLYLNINSFHFSLIPFMIEHESGTWYNSMYYSIKV